MENNAWFYAMGACSKEVQQKTGLEVAARTPSSLYEVLAKFFGRRAQLIIDAESLISNNVQASLAAQLSHAFDKYGSDKSTTHNYHLIYGAILPCLTINTKILEIGLGSNNTEVISNMGRHGMPGASLRAFMDCVPSALIHGADIDQSIVVEGAEIFYVDQRNTETFAQITKRGQILYDLIIDDGMHTADTNLNTLNFAISALSSNGVCVIEDINESNLPIWASVQLALYHSMYDLLIVKTKAAFAVICYQKFAHGFSRTLPRNSLIEI